MVEKFLIAVFGPFLSIFDTFNHPSGYLRPNLGHSFKKITSVINKYFIRVINFLFNRFNQIICA
jgi:hypothetical protein